MNRRTTGQRLGIREKERQTQKYPQNGEETGKRRQQEREVKARSTSSLMFRMAGAQMLREGKKCANVCVSETE